MTTHIVLYAEDDENDAFLIKRAWRQAGIAQPLVIVDEGQAAIDYLSGAGTYADRALHPLPCLVLLDLNMPGVSGIDVLKWTRTNPGTATLPVVVLTSSNQNSDVQRAYAEGANGYLVKPGSLEDMALMAKGIHDYWLALNRGANAVPPPTHVPATAAV